MDEVRSLTHAYSQAPWRKQVQVLVIFLLVVVFSALIASVYLYVKSQAVAAGVEAQTLHIEINETKLAVEDYESQLANLISEKVMAERAEALGYHPVEPDQIKYIRVPGYTPRQPEVMVPPPVQSRTSKTELSPAYSESLLDWLSKNILAPSGWFNEVEP
jgi:cell division protein FtsL